MRLNEFGLPIGDPVPDWTPRPRPAREALIGRYSRLEPLDADRHAASMHDAEALDAEGRNWTYLSRVRPTGVAGYRAWAVEAQKSEDPFFYAIVDPDSGDAVGLASYLRIDPANGVIEVGHLNFSPRLQRTRASTEAMYLMMRHAFDTLGYRRYEWKCDALNEPSRRAALRLGFTFEGVFRQAVVVHGRNRDSAWFAIIDKDWPAVRAEFERWLAPENFDGEGRQRSALVTRVA